MIWKFMYDINRENVVEDLWQTHMLTKLSRNIQGNSFMLYHIDYSTLAIL